MKRLLPTLLMLLWPTLAGAQTITLPAKLELPSAGLVIVRATAVDADDVRFWCNDANLQTFPPDIVPAKLGVFMGFTVKEGLYKVSCIPAKAKDGKAVIGQMQTCEVTVGTPKPPDPPVPVTVVVPVLIGKTSGEAIQALTLVGLKYEVVGDGTKNVVGTSPDAGTTVAGGSVVKLIMGAPPSPAPIPGDGLRVLMVYSKDDLGKIPYQQELALYDQSIIKYLNAKCPKGPDGQTPERRLWEAGVTGLENESKLWQDAFKRPRTSSPWIIVSNGKTGFEGPLPANVADTLALLKKYGGE